MTLLTYLPMIGAAAATGIIAYGAHSLDVDRIEAKQRDELAAQATGLQAQCKADKAITTTVETDYENKLNDLNGALADAISVQPTACITVSAPGPASGHNGTAKPVQSAHTNAVPASAIFTLAGEGEKYRLQLIALQNFITLTWAAKGQ